MKSVTNSPRAILGLCTAMLIYGTVGIVRRCIPLSSGLVSLVRGVLGGLSLLGFTLATGKQSKTRMPAGQLALLALTGALMGINWALLFEAYSCTSVSTATLCYYMEPTIVILLSPIVFRERLTGRKLACAAAAVLGMVLVSGILEGSAEANLQGILCGLGAAVLYASVVILNKLVHTDDICGKTIVQLFAASAVMFPYVLLTGEPLPAAIEAGTVLLLLVLGTVHTGLAYLLYFGSLTGLKAQTAAVLSYIDPVSALILSALLLHEAMTPLAAAGAVLIIGAAIAGEINFNRKRGKTE